MQFSKWSVMNYIIPTATIIIASEIIRKVLVAQNTKPTKVITFIIMVLIDLALYHEDGYVFFDSSYFELSLLLHNFINDEFTEWIKLISDISQQNWENIECKDKKITKV